jgi:hypothetical protein
VKGALWDAILETSFFFLPRNGLGECVEKPAGFSENRPAFAGFLENRPVFRKPADFLTQKPAGFLENRPVFEKTGRFLRK